MVSTYTTNKNLEKPGNGDYVDTWNVPLNGDMNLIDQAFGGVTFLNATSGSAVLAANEYVSLIINVSGAIGSTVTYTIPSGVGGQWIVLNTATGANVYFNSAAGGASILVSGVTAIFCDGTSTGMKYVGVTATGGGASGTWNISISGNAATATNAVTATNVNGGTVNATSGTFTSLLVNGDINATGNVTAYYSDERLKTRLGVIDSPLEKVKQLDGFYYEANDVAVSLGYQKIREVGVSAQQVQAIMPEIVCPAPIDKNYLTVHYERLVPLLIEAIKELTAKVELLEKK